MTSAVWLLGLVLTIAGASAAGGRGGLASTPGRAADPGARDRRAQGTFRAARRRGRPTDAEADIGQVEPPAPSHGPFRFLPLPEWVPARAKPRRRGLANVAVAGESEGARGDSGPRRSARSTSWPTRALGGKVKHYSVADACLRAVLLRDPDHAEARRLLGYVPHDGGWATPFAVDQFKKGKVLHPTYGWVDASWVPHLEQGELPARGMTNPKEARWLPAAEADCAAEHDRAGLEDSDRALRDPGRRPALRGDRLWPQGRAVPRPALLAPGRRGCGRPAAGPALPRQGEAAAPADRRTSIYYFATKDEYLEYLRLSRGADLESSLGDLHPPQEAGRPPGPPTFSAMREAARRHRHALSTRSRTSSCWNRRVPGRTPSGRTPATSGSSRGWARTSRPSSPNPTTRSGSAATSDRASRTRGGGCSKTARRCRSSSSSG